MAKQKLNPTANVVSLPRRSLHRVQDLRAHGLLSATHNMAQLNELTERYAIAITPAMVDQMDKTDLAHDPVAKQFIPDVQELRILPEEYPDPIGDYKHTHLKALVHRHTDRVLLKPTLACAVYCRFCFRREMVGPHGDRVTNEDVDAAIDYIAEHSELREVILTGGDPLILSPNRLQSLMERLHAIPHLDWIRIHTRVPIVQPDKMTADLLQAIAGEKPVSFVLHINHVRELSAQAIAGIQRLHAAGYDLLSQSVLLRHINNTVYDLADLFTTLVKHHIKPYYLHHADLAGGTGHFRVSLDEGKELMNALRQRVSGLAVPHYVIDIPGGVTKIPVNSDYVQAIANQPGAYWLTAPDGQKYFYRDPAVI